MLLSVSIQIDHAIANHGYVGKQAVSQKARIFFCEFSGCYKHQKPGDISMILKQDLNLPFFVQPCDQYFSFPCRYVIKELVHDLAVHLSSYECTWEVWRALVKLELRG